MLVPKFSEYKKGTTPDIIYKKIPELEPLNYTFYSFDETKVYSKYIKKIESLVRGSLEYRRYITYLKNEMELTSCHFFRNIDIKNIKGASIEFHHYPFTLYDIVNIIICKNSDFYEKPVKTFDIANEVMELHYLNQVGLIPLSKTVHELAHSGKVYIDLNNIFGDYNFFVKNNYEHIDSELLDKLEMLKEYDDISNNEILSKSFQYIISEFDKIDYINIENKSNVAS